MITKLSNKESSIYLNCRYSKRLVNKLLLMNQRSRNKIDLNKIKKAIHFAKKYHDKQERWTGEPFYSHPLEVACMVSEYLFRTDVIVTAILHDTVEDTALTKEIIAKEFGDEIANQVADLTRVKKGKKISSIEIIATLYQQKKKDLLLIKLFDRLHNMQTIEAKPLEKIWKTTAETLQTFLNLATYLAMPDVKEKLNEHCYNIILNYKRSLAMFAMIEN